MSISGTVQNPYQRFISDLEWRRLTPPQQSALGKNVALGSDLNQRFRRSAWYPLPRDLCFPVEIALLHRWASQRKQLVEIGVFEGTSSRRFRTVMAPNATLHLIDPFVVVPDSDLTARPWMARMSVRASRNGSVRWYRDYSYHVVRHWREPIDLLFIDGDHAYEACRKDWDLWHPFVVVGGVVLFHDARIGRGSATEWDGWPGPSFVVDELFRGASALTQWNIVDESGSLVVVQRMT